MAAGIHVEQFVHEPLAALYGHLRPKPDFHQQLATLRDQVVLVFDWGGGTLDLTLCRFETGALGVCAAENRCDNCRRASRRRKDSMSTTFRPYAPDQSLLLPPDVREWLPEGHFAKIDLSISDHAHDLRQKLTCVLRPYEDQTADLNVTYQPRRTRSPSPAIWSRTVRRPLIGCSSLHVAQEDGRATSRSALLVVWETFRIFTGSTAAAFWPQSPVRFPAAW